MKEAELKQNITKITQILQSENYEAGFELLKTLDEPELTAGLSDVIDTTLREKYFKENAIAIPPIATRNAAAGFSASGARSPIIF